MNFVDILATATTVVISSGIAAAAVSLVTLRKTREIEEGVRRRSEQRLTEFLSRREAKEKVLNEVIGPVVMNLHRTAQAFRRYSSASSETDVEEEGISGKGSFGEASKWAQPDTRYLEVEILKRANENIRDILLAKGYWLDGELLEHSIRLIEHYDAWLEEWDKRRSSGAKEGKIWAGPQGYPFPIQAEAAFIKECKRIRNQLYQDGSE